MLEPSVRDHLNIGCIVFQRMDQSDFTGPFEVLSRVPNSTFYVIGRDHNSVRDVRGLILTPEIRFSDSPALDVLIVPGGEGQEDLMDDEVVLSFLRHQCHGAKYIFSVCTGALLCGAAGVLQGVRATTHWSALHLLEYFGAIPVHARVVIDGKYVSAAGVTAGLDGALRLVSLVGTDEIAQQIQLGMEYAPEPPFDSGNLQSAPPGVVKAVRDGMQRITQRRLDTAKRVAERLGVHLPCKQPA
jgi:cyclohexyl-isocyanide hydratase